MNLHRIGRLPVALLALIFPVSVAFSLPLPTVEGPIPGDPVKVDGGLIAGKILPSGVHAYFGVPFAAPPIRELRWQPPQPVPDWSGVYNADRFSPKCIQTFRGSRQNHYFGSEAISENCLYLNIWKPAAASDEPLPVVVWIYGGAWNVGSSAMRNYSGENLARKGVIYVSMNYRLGAFGFLAHPELTAESPHNASGNFGLLDQVFALEWVKRNIAKFGGNPDNVSIIGQSAGSMSVSSLQASPLAQGLIHRAIGLSGSSVSARFAGPGALDEAEKSGLRLQQELEAASIAEMRYLAPHVIFNQARESRLRFSPVVDGWLLPRSPYAILTDGAQNDIPLLIGFTRDEGFSPLARAKTVTEYKELANTLFESRADRFLELYPVASDADVSRAGRDAARDSTFGSSMWVWARLQNSSGESPVYAYMFSRVQPYSSGITFADHNAATAGAYHTGSVPYYLQTLDSLNLYRTTRDWSSYDRGLSDVMSDCIVSFARTGTPICGDIDWPAFNPNAARMMEFGDSINVIEWPNQQGLKFFSGE